MMKVALPITIFTAAFMVQSCKPFMAGENGKPDTSPAEKSEEKQPPELNWFNLEAALTKKDLPRAKTYIGKDVLMNGIRVGYSNPIRLSIFSIRDSEVIRDSTVKWVIYLKSSEVKDVAGNQADLVFVEVSGKVKSINYKRNTVYVISRRSFVTGEHNQTRPEQTNE